MTENNSSTNKKTLSELATEYMQEYYCTFSHYGEHHPKTQLNYACWQALKTVLNNIRDSKALVVVPPPMPEVQKTRFRSLIDWAKLLFKSLTGGFIK